MKLKEIWRIIFLKNRFQRKNNMKDPRLKDFVSVYGAKKKKILTVADVAKEIEE